MSGMAEPVRNRGHRPLLAVLFLVLISISACSSGVQTPPPPGPGPVPGPGPGPSSVPAGESQAQFEVLILPLGQKTQQELPYWTSEAQRLVLAYFDIFLRHGFSEKTASRVTVADDSTAADGLELVFQGREERGGQEWWSWLPTSGTVEYLGRTPDFVLIFDGLRFRIRSGGGARQTYDVPGGGQVEIDLEYVLWDNRNQEIAAYGRLHEESRTSSPHPSSELFRNLFLKMAEDIVKNSPFND